MRVYPMWGPAAWRTAKVKHVRGYGEKGQLKHTAMIPICNAKNEMQQFGNRRVQNSTNRHISQQEDPGVSNNCTYFIISMRLIW